MTSKKCRSCGETKPGSEFYNSGRKTLAGKIIKDTLCKPCKIEYRRKRRSKIKEFINNYKAEKGCEKCGYSHETHESFKVHALEFHHAQGNKEFNIGDAIGRGFCIDKIKQEINKCVILCSRCHAEIHADEREKI